MPLADHRAARPADKSHNRREEAALLAVLQARPLGVRPVILADCGFDRAAFLAWLQRQGRDDVIRVSKGTGLTGADGRRWELGQEGLRPGQVRWAPHARSTLEHGRPRDLWTTMVLCRRQPR